MSVYRVASTLKDRFQLVLSSFLQGEDFRFPTFCPAEAAFTMVFDEAGASFAEDEENAVYTPAVTLWAFLSQVLFKAEQLQLPRGCFRARDGISGRHGAEGLLEEHQARTAGARAKLSHGGDPPVDDGRAQPRRKRRSLTNVSGRGGT